MATTNVALPPIGQISMVGIWVATVLYGINCVVYSLCMFKLLRGRKIPPLRWVLLVTSTILFLLCTIHIGASLQQLLDAFIYVPAGVPDYSTTYWLDNSSKLRVLKDTIYDALMTTQEFILIWQLYVVFTYNWRAVILPIILDIAFLGTTYATLGILASPNVGPYYGFAPRSLVVFAWVVNIALNAGVTVTIVARLWWMGRITASLMATRINPYASLILVVVESGAIFTSATIAVLVLYALNSPATWTGVDVASQLAALTPLLIIAVRVRHGVSREQNPRQNIPLPNTTRFRSPSLANGAHV